MFEAEDTSLRPQTSNTGHEDRRRINMTRRKIAKIDMEG